MAKAKDDLEEIRAANDGFYRAFESLDILQMDKVWVHADYVKCVHPGWGLLTGWDAVRASWEMIFRNTGEIRLTLTGVRIEAQGRLAWVVLTENIISHLGGELSATSVLATNIFERTGDSWRMIHHHASHVLQGRLGSGPPTVH